MAEERREARENSGEAGAETAPRKAGAPRMAMLFSATGWTFNVRLGRSGREEGEGIIIMGEVSYRTAGGERRVHPGRAMVVKSDARKRLDLDRYRRLARDRRLLAHSALPASVWIHASPHAFASSRTRRI